MKVIAFPFAGGDKYAFNFLRPYLSKKNIALEVMEYPGRGQRIHENFYENIDEIVADILLKLPNSIHHESYLIYGHSMGALTGYLVCKKIEELKIKKPLKLIVSGRKAPVVAKEEKTYHLSGNKFWKKVMEYGGVPEEVFEETELIAFFEPILRADFRIVEEYRYTGRAKLNIPIDVIYGNEEIENEAEVLKWQEETEAETQIFKYKGNHFFIYENAEYIANHFIREFK